MSLDLDEAVKDAIADLLCCKRCDVCREPATRFNRRGYYCNDHLPARTRQYMPKKIGWTPPQVSCPAFTGIGYEDEWL
jgi:hypothetical protein